MSEFVNTLDSKKFASTNGLWNELTLNDPWSVGYVTTLIVSSPFHNKEEWEIFYYNSGAKRNQEIIKLKDSERVIVTDELYKKNNPILFNKINYSLKNINHNFGRTEDDFKKKGAILFDELKKRNLNKLNLTEEEATECVRFRVICETWNGVIVREHNTIEKLKKLFPDLTFKKSGGDADYKYGIDYELSKDDELVCAIQIKPRSYFYNFPYLKIAQSANQIKHDGYKKVFKSPVYYITADMRGNIIDNNQIKNIRGLLD